MFHRRIIIKRSYGPGDQTLYDIKMTNLPIRDLERFGEGILSTSATHTPQVLFSLLTEAIGNQEKAQQLLRDLRDGDAVEVMMLDQADTKLVDKLKTSSAIDSNGRQRLMNVNATRDSSDGVLRVELVEHDPRTGNGQIHIIELRQEHARSMSRCYMGRDSNASTTRPTTS